MRILAAALVSALGLLPGGEAVHAAAITREGLTFSDELGGFRLVSVSGTGWADDPFVLVEEITGPEPPVLVIRGLTAAFGNRVGTHHLAGFALTKIAINATTESWTVFDMELRQVPEAHSPYFDGLSFGQGAVRRLGSDIFPQLREVDEPFDSMQFSGGIVAPGERVAFALVVTDTSPVGEFFLLQRQLQEVALLSARRGF